TLSCRRLPFSADELSCQSGVHPDTLSPASRLTYPSLTTMTTSQSAPHTAAVYQHVDKPDGASAPAPDASGNWRFLLLPAVLALLVGSFAFFTRDVILQCSFVGAAAALLIWCAALAVSAQRAGRALAIEVVRRPQHWVQALGQGSLILYWASYNHFVFGFF